MAGKLMPGRPRENLLGTRKSRNISCSYSNSVKVIVNGVSMRKIFLFCLVSFCLFGVIFQCNRLQAADTNTMSVNVTKGDMVWGQLKGTHKQIYFSTVQPGTTTWTTPVAITNDSYRNGQPVIDTGANGKRWVLWAAGSGSKAEIHYSMEANGNWSKTAAIPSGLKINVTPSVLVDASGKAWAAWSGNNGGQDEIYYSRFIDNAWTTPQMVNTPNNVPDILPVLSLNQNKEVQVAWYGYRDGGYVKLQSTWEGNSWSTEVVIQGNSQGISQQLTQGTQQTNGVQTNADVANMPSFIKQPEKAFVRVYTFSRIK